jgi:hypothetical protein
MRDQYDSMNKPRRNGREMGTWRLTSIWVVNRAPVLIAAAPVFEGVDVGDVGSRGQTLKQGVVAILVVGTEHGELVDRVGFTAQQEGERHKDSRLYRGSGDEQCSRESAGAKGESKGLLWWSTGCHRENGEISGSCRQGKEREEDGICDEGDSRVRRE